MAITKLRFPKRTTQIQHSVLSLDYLSLTGCHLDFISVFGDCPYQSVLLYLDDVIVFSYSIQQHLGTVEEVFSQLWKQGLNPLGHLDTAKSGALE